jgi:hypothetical protein
MGTVDNSLVKVKNSDAANRFNLAHQYLYIRGKVRYQWEFP